MTLGQSVIKGTVTDSQTGNPLPGVNVYLSGTTFGASTDENGFYKLRASEPGSYNLVFSIVGFEQTARQVELGRSSSKTVNTSLNESVQQLKEIEVRASNKKWKKQYNYFFKQFIGRAEWAEQVTVENPWVLDFEEDNDILKATAERPLEITNKALGYKLHVDLIDFKWPTYSNRGGGYKFFTRFDLITPESAQQELEWKKNRARSYLGSVNHFLKTLYDNNISESDFSVQYRNDISELSKGETKYELLNRGDISQKRRENIQGYKIKREVDIEYDGRAEFIFDSKEFSFSIHKEGGIDSNTESRIFFVDQYGSLFNPLSLVAYGNWADARVATDVPTNYEIGD